MQQIPVHTLSHLPQCRSSVRMSAQSDPQPRFLVDTVADALESCGDPTEVRAQSRVEFGEALTEDAFIDRAGRSALDRGIRSLSDHVQKCSTFEA